MAKTFSTKNGCCVFWKPADDCIAFSTEVIDGELKFPYYASERACMELAHFFAARGVELRKATKRKSR